jgi:hypothetical protein
MKTLKKTFYKFGRGLKFINKKEKLFCLYRPENLRILPMNKRFNVQENTNIVKLLNQTWFDESCAIRGNMENIDTHYIKSVRRFRVKTRTYVQWKGGGFQRKYIPLCTEYYHLYNAGKLSPGKVKRLSTYNGKKNAN